MLFALFAAGLFLNEVYSKEPQEKSDNGFSTTSINCDTKSEAYCDSLANVLERLRIPSVATIWKRAGLETEIPDYLNIIHLKLSPHKNDSESNSERLQQTIDKAFPGTVIILDCGVYYFSGEVNMKSGTILRGKGAQFTHLYFNNLSSAYRGAVNFTGKHGRGTPIASGLEQGSTHIGVADNYGIPAGSTIMLTQLNDSAWMETQNPKDWDVTWADRSVGQMVKVKTVGHEVFELAEPVRYHDYKYSLEPRYYFLTKKVEYAGIEDLTIEMVPDTLDAGRFTVQFNLAENCWMKGVTLLNAHRGHLNIMHGRNLLITNNTFKDAQQKGRGAGIDIGLRTGNCLVIDNEFFNLRQSVILQTGSNANVIANNKIKGNDPTNPCISVRGHWTYLNLIERNEADIIAVGNLYGPAGEGTTLYRNKISKRISVEDRSYHVNIISNEVMENGDIYVDTRAIKPFLWQNHIINSSAGNQQKNAVQLPASLYQPCN